MVLFFQCFKIFLSLIFCLLFLLRLFLLTHIQTGFRLDFCFLLISGLSQSFHLWSEILNLSFNIVNALFMLWIFFPEICYLFFNQHYFFLTLLNQLFLIFFISCFNFLFCLLLFLVHEVFTLLNTLIKFFNVFFVKLHEIFSRTLPN